MFKVLRQSDGKFTIECYATLENGDFGLVWSMQNITKEDAKRFMSGRTISENEKWFNDDALPEVWH